MADGGHKHHNNRHDSKARSNVEDNPFYHHHLREKITDSKRERPHYHSSLHSQHSRPSYHGSPHQKKHKKEIATPNNALFLRVSGWDGDHPTENDLVKTFADYEIKECSITRQRLESNNRWSIEFRAHFPTLTRAKQVLQEFRGKKSDYGGNWFVIYCRSSCGVLVDGVKYESLEGKSSAEQESIIKTTLRSHFPKAFHVRAEPEKLRGFVTFSSNQEANEVVREYQDFEVDEHEYQIQWTFRLSFYEATSQPRRPKRSNSDDVGLRDSEQHRSDSSTPPPRKRNKREVSEEDDDESSVSPDVRSQTNGTTADDVDSDDADDSWSPGPTSNCNTETAIEPSHDEQEFQSSSDKALLKQAQDVMLILSTRLCELSKENNQLKRKLSKLTSAEKEREANDSAVMEVASFDKDQDFLELLLNKKKTTVKEEEKAILVIRSALTVAIDELESGKDNSSWLQQSGIEANMSETARAIVLKTLPKNLLWSYGWLGLLYPIEKLNVPSQVVNQADDKEVAMDPKAKGKWHRVHLLTASGDNGDVKRSKSCYVTWIVVNQSDVDKIHNVNGIDKATKLSSDAIAELLKKSNVGFSKFNQYCGDVIVLDCNSIYFKHFVAEDQNQNKTFVTYSWNLSSYSTDLFVSNQLYHPKNVIEDYENFVWRVVNYLRQKDSLVSEDDRKAISQAVLSDIETSFGNFVHIEEDIKKRHLQTFQDSLGRIDDDDAPGGSLPNFWGLKHSDQDASISSSLMRKKQVCVKCSSPIFGFYFTESLSTSSSAVTGTSCHLCYECGVKTNQSGLNRIYRKAELMLLREFCNSAASM
eukprot:TRINITY_DN1266_c0_g1_i9.p1 TRINITY_DN1266_c0_g1~~TRINITY_DN1266_c0_g1_i9.p1  ORF type:complete len:814 (-),score=210.41 TRINITY_DN1266_c0_g1_i9:109-2550(-)